ncbi:hypothetical protein GWI33_010423 [Rhynchophorus ferrugineus]|uniref:Uncharacterized protein n=1 Tax=Rhynchophorus ferrugineus TaxID=354439 RepID=A0A834IV53_RHYFE|nr:hypothetical protein GWI33_010423 [Rhynchophorus ferrugineus]
MDRPQLKIIKTDETKRFAGSVFPSDTGTKRVRAKNSRSCVLKALASSSLSAAELSLWFSVDAVVLVGLQPSQDLKKIQVGVFSIYSGRKSDQQIHWRSILVKYVRYVELAVVPGSSGAGFYPVLFNLFAKPP